MITILLIGLLVYLVYTISSVIKYNAINKTKMLMPSSISETFYFMPHFAFVMFLMIEMGIVMTFSYMYMDAMGSY